MLGGMMTPIAPAQAESAAAKEVSYFFSVISGIMKEPIAETVAGPEPEIAAKNMQAIVVTSARPPVTWPTSLLKRLSRRREMPPYIMKLPATTKNGIARSVKESRPVKQAVSYTHLRAHETDQ